jgi:hypothetical protein
MSSAAREVREPATVAAGGGLVKEIRYGGAFEGGNRYAARESHQQSC